MAKHAIKFRFSGKMARLLGRESVSSDIAALFELVKNGYDADASKVDVRFENFLKDGGRHAQITVEDDGTGMMMDDIENKWMIIGTDTKERITYTRGKRRVIGNKGVGRFATEKLCRKLILISKPRGVYDEIKLEIDWDKYEEAEAIFDEITNPIDTKERENKKETGTKLIMRELRESWTPVKVDKLRLALGSLVLPKEIAEFSNDAFSVNVFAPEFQSEESPEILSVLFKYAPYKIIATMPENGSIFKVTIRQENKLILEERVDLKDVIMDNGELWKSFGKCKFILYFFPGKSRYEDWNKYYKKALNVNSITGMLSDIHGTKIYRDGFWVRPYGDLGDDWLSLEEERVQANYKIGNSQVVGFVQITKDENPGLVDTTTRERLVENTEFHSLRTFVKEAIESVNAHRYDLNRKLKQNQTKKQHQNILESEIKHLKEMVEKNHSLSASDKTKFNDALGDISRTFLDFEKKTDEDIDELEIFQRAYRNLASLGISSATAAHEISHVIAHLGEIPKAMLNKLKKQAEARSLIEEDMEIVIDRINTIRYFMKFVIRFVENLSYDTEIKHEKEKVEVNSTIEQFTKDFTGITKMNEIDVKFSTSPENLTIHMNMADFLSMILNLFSNSIKALQRLQKNEERKIMIKIYKDSSTFNIVFSDSGPGVSPINRDKIFRLFFTTNKQSTGMGLPIIKEILDDYGGTIELMEHSELSEGATFHISIPLKELKL